MRYADGDEGDELDSSRLLAGVINHEADDAPLEAAATRGCCAEPATPVARNELRVRWHVLCALACSARRSPWRACCPGPSPLPSTGATSCELVLRSPRSSLAHRAPPSPAGLACLALMGSYYCYDIPAATMTQMENTFSGHSSGGRNSTSNSTSADDDGDGAGCGGSGSSFPTNFNLLYSVRWGRAVLPARARVRRGTQEAARVAERVGLHDHAQRDACQVHAQRDACRFPQRGSLNGHPAHPHHLLEGFYDSPAPRSTRGRTSCCRSSAATWRTCWACAS